MKLPLSRLWNAVRRFVLARMRWFDITVWT
jgi:hypothetical protein